MSGESEAADRGEGTDRRSLLKGTAGAARDLRGGRRGR